MQWQKAFRQSRLSIQIIKVCSLKLWSRFVPFYRGKRKNGVFLDAARKKKKETQPNKQDRALLTWSLRFDENSSADCLAIAPLEVDVYCAAMSPYSKCHIMIAVYSSSNRASFQEDQSWCDAFFLTRKITQVPTECSAWHFCRIVSSLPPEETQAATWVWPACPSISLHRGLRKILKQPFHQ